LKKKGNLLKFLHKRIHTTSSNIISWFITKWTCTYGLWTIFWPTFWIILTSCSKIFD
jgi:hypothetical protein